MAQNQAAFLDEKGARLSVRDAPTPKAVSGRVVIKNHAVAVNPVDWKIQDSGFFIQKWPTVLGEDFAGEVVEVGEGVTRFKKGDRVTAHGVSLVTGDVNDGGFNLYSSVPAATTAHLPEKISFTQGSVLPLAFDTAAVGLYSTGEGFLGLPKPQLKPKHSNKTIVVWGGSSSVGAFVVQLAVASGVTVVATASEHNFELVRGWGASEVINYKSASVVEDVVKAVERSGSTFAGIYDCISLADQSYKHVLPILEKLGGGNLAIVLQPPENVPSNVKVGGVFAVNDLVHEFWSDFITPALESGLLKCVPEPFVVGKGLESVQKGLDENKRGVSARKVVIEL